MRVIDKVQSQPNLGTLLRKVVHHFAYYLKFTKRMRSVTRVSMEIELEKLVPLLKPGVILDIGAEDAPYRKLIPATRYLTMDVTPAFEANIVSDIHQIGCSSNVFDGVIATEVLEHCHNPFLAVSEIYRVLKPEGMCILT